jgi:hypothetical protein
MARMALLLLRWKIEARERAEIVWESRWAGVVFVGCFAVGAGCLEHWVPSPGVSVAFMGVAAALMTARTKATGIEKAVWMVLISSLLVIEVLAIRKDRKEHDDALAKLLNEEVAARLEAKQNFGDIGKGIEATITKSDAHFDATMDKSNGILAGIGDTLKTETGGNSFCWVYFEKQLHRGAMRMFALHEGNYPLSDVTVTVINQQRVDRILKENPLAGVRSALMVFGPFDLAVHDQKELTNYAEMTGDNQKFTIQIRAKNGLWDEDAHLKFIPGPYGHPETGIWVQAVRVVKQIRGEQFKPAKKAEIFRCIEPLFPRNELHWPKPLSESAICTQGYPKK